MKHLLYLFIISLSLTACSQEKQPNPRAVALNDQALKLAMGPGDTTKNLNAAIVLLDQALKIDPSYIGSYWNKADLLLDLKAYQRAMSVIDSALLIKRIPDFVLLKGTLSETLGNKAAAAQLYQEARLSAEAAYAKTPTAPQLLLYVLATKFSQGTQSAMKILNAEKGRFKNSPDHAEQLEQLMKELPDFTAERYLN